MWRAQGTPVGDQDNEWAYRPVLGDRSGAAYGVHEAAEAAGMTVEAAKRYVGRHKLGRRIGPGRTILLSGADVTALRNRRRPGKPAKKEATS